MTCDVILYRNMLPREGFGSASSLFKVSDSGIGWVHVERFMWDPPRILELTMDESGFVNWQFPESCIHPLSLLIR